MTLDGGLHWGPQLLVTSPSLSGAWGLLVTPLLHHWSQGPLVSSLGHYHQRRRAGRCCWTSRLVAYLESCLVGNGQHWMQLPGRLCGVTATEGLCFIRGTWGQVVCDLETLCTGWGCALVGGEGCGIWLGWGVCGAGSGVRFLVKMSCWIGQICYLFYSFPCLGPQCYNCVGLRLYQWWCLGCMSIEVLGTGRVLPG